MYVQFWTENSLKWIQIQDDVHVLDCVGHQCVMTLPWQWMLCSAISLVFSCSENCEKSSFGDDSVPAEIWISVEKLTKIYLVILHWHKLGKWTFTLGIKSCHACIKTKKPRKTESERKADKEQFLSTHASADFCWRAWTNTCVNKNTAIKYIDLFPSSITDITSLLKNPQSTSMMAETFLTNLLSLNSTYRHTVLPYLSAPK